MNDEGGSGDMRALVEQYRQIVLQYEALDEQIDTLIMAHGGTTDRMPPEDLARYRQLASERDALHNEMRVMEQQLALDE